MMTKNCPHELPFACLTLANLRFTSTIYVLFCDSVLPYTNNSKIFLSYIQIKYAILANIFADVNHEFWLKI